MARRKRTRGGAKRAKKGKPQRSQRSRGRSFSRKRSRNTREEAEKPEEVRPFEYRKVFESKSDDE